MEFKRKFEVLVLCLCLLCQSAFSAPKSIPEFNIERIKSFFDLVWGDAKVSSKVRFASSGRGKVFEKLREYPLPSNEVQRKGYCAVMESIAKKVFTDDKVFKNSFSKVAQHRRRDTHLSRAMLCGHIGRMMAYTDFAAELLLLLGEHRCDAKKVKGKTDSSPSILKVDSHPEAYATIFKARCFKKDDGSRRKATGPYQSTFRSIKDVLNDTF